LHDRGVDRLAARPMTSKRNPAGRIPIFCSRFAKVVARFVCFAI
jgi:hypothetical protein